MDEEYISTQIAAELAGTSASALHAAARKGKLTTRQFGALARLTTRAWLDAYLASVKPRGRPRGGGSSPPGNDERTGQVGPEAGE